MYASALTAGCDIVSTLINVLAVVPCRSLNPRTASPVLCANTSSTYPQLAVITCEVHINHAIAHFKRVEHSMA